MAQPEKSLPGLARCLTSRGQNWQRTANRIQTTVTGLSSHCSRWCFYKEFFSSCSYYCPNQKICISVPTCRIVLVYLVVIVSKSATVGIEPHYSVNSLWIVCLLFMLTSKKSWFDLVYNPALATFLVISVSG